MSRWNNEAIAQRGGREVGHGVPDAKMVVCGRRFMDPWRGVHGMCNLMGGDEE
jgi:hypothetical protein